MTQRTSGAGLLCLLMGLSLAGLGCREDATAPTVPEPTLATSTLSSAAAPLSFLHVSAGFDHGCGVASDNRAYCWGSNTWGQLGDGTQTRRLRPVPVSGGLRFLEVRAGDGHTCGITTERRAYCWGQGGLGQLGNGTTAATQRTPVPVSGTRRFSSISAGRRYTCAVNPFNVAFCWGDNSWRQLGANVGFFTTTPVRVAGGLLFRRIGTAHSHTCGTTTDNRAYCWGQNSAGQLGNGLNTSSGTPVRVAGGLSFRSVLPGSGYISDAGDPFPDFAYSCGITTADRMYCWGLTGNTPVAVGGTRRWQFVNPGGFHTCGLTLASVALCWGTNSDGQVGDGTTTSRSAPVRVAGGVTFRGLTAPALGFHTCGVDQNNRAYCWGLNSSGQLGDGTTTRRLTPTPVAGP